MALPAFNEEGDLPPGVHGATLSEVLERFGQGSVQRCAVADRLNRLYQLAAVTATGGTFCCVRLVCHRQGRTERY